MSWKPKKGPIDAFTDMRLPLFFLLVWAMPITAAVEEGVPLMGIVLCTFFSLYFIALQMWMPI